MASSVDSAPSRVLSQVLELTAGPALVQSLGYNTPVNSATAMRGRLPLKIQVATSGVATALPTGARLYYGIKLESALKGDWLALCELIASTEENSTGLWTGALQINTPSMRSSMHADVNDPAPELTRLACLAEIYYTVPNLSDPVLSLNYDFIVKSPLYNGTEGIAPDPNTPFPAAATLNALISPYRITATSGTTTIPAGTRTACLHAYLTGTLTASLPLASTLTEGQTIVFTDNDFTSPTNTFSLSVQSNDQLISHLGNNSFVIFDGAGPQQIAAVSNGSNRWDIIRADRLGTLSTGNIGTTAGKLAALGNDGTFAPARLASGTPSSTTFLRGDGAWAGITPGGNTLAATGSLLMGDGAGNAAAAAATTLGRVSTVRGEVQRALEARPANLLTASNGYGGDGPTINADGTITVPARSGGVDGAVGWQLSAPSGVTLYGYAVATGETRYGALRFRCRYYSDTHDSEATDATLAPGVYRTQFLSAGSAVGSYVVYLYNSSSSPITVFFPVVATVDSGLALLTSQADYTPVAPQPVTDLNFTPVAAGDRLGRFLAERQTTYAADSVNGTPGGDQTLDTPTEGLTDKVYAGGEVVGLYRGSVFRESLPLSGLGSAHGIVVQDIARGSIKPLPIVSALDGFNNGSFIPGGDGSYTGLWYSEGDVVKDGYSNVYVVEINTALEATQPRAARRRMTEVTSISAVASTPGSVLIGNVGTAHWSARLHPSDNVAPGSGSYRYEVVSRAAATGGWYTGNVFGDGAMSGLELVGGSSGYGPLSGPTGFVGDRLVVQHATTHNAVLGGGSLSRSVFYEGGDDDSIMLAWYAANPTGLSWSMDRCLFYAGTRPTDMVIAHSGSGGQNYTRGDIADCAFIGAGRVNGALSNTGFVYNNVAAGVIERTYLYGVRTVFGTSLPVSTEVRNSVFRQVQTCNIGVNFHDNFVLAEPAGVNYATASPCAFTAVGASATNNLFWAHGITNGFPYNDGANAINIQAANCTCSRNIFVLNPSSTTDRSSYFYKGSADVSTLVVDYNLVINLGKAGIDSQGNHFSWAEHQAAYPTIDAHSMYVDLSSDPRGLRAVFADPDNGDFRWAQTEVARRCAAYCRANNVGPRAVTSRWPVVPTVDEAVRMLAKL